MSKKTLCIMLFVFLAEALLGLKQVLAITSKSSTKLEHREKTTSSPWNKISADVSGSYSWGTYSAPGVTDDAHLGMSLPFYGGYRFSNGIDAGISATVAFPEVSTRNAVSDASFSYLGAGLQAGYLLRQKFEPFLSFYPYSKLSQSTDNRLGTATIHTDISYTGMAFGGGAKVYLTERDNQSVQIGLKFSYFNERYSRSKFESRVEPLAGQNAPAFRSVSSPQSGDQRITGNTYQLGLFIGI